MPSARCLFVFACALSVMVASPVYTYPTTISLRSRSVGPNTLLGRQYQLSKRNPLILLDPALNQGLDTSHLGSSPPKTPKQPVSEPHRAFKQEETTKNTTTMETGTHHANSTASYNTPVTARRLMPYREQLAERATIQRLEPRKPAEANHLSRVKKPSSSFSFNNGEPAPEKPSPPPIENSFANHTTTVAAAFSQPTSHRATQQTPHTSGQNLVEGLLSGLTPPVR